MKKFLSLVLALIMTMSLVTIGASAAEYDDFTDKDEIQYEEAVAVLNRLGIITGYSEGDFRPEGELTRGAAAKIIVSLLIGPEAANNVSPTTAPYKDVPLDHTFAGVIAYCKTAGIISGYSDGSFQPGGTLTGYAFSKMLLGALGFKSDVEGFTGAGWNMNVNARAAEAGLFDRLSFKGNDPVNREQAAQLALNTLKATMVEYSGGINVTTSDGSTMTSPANRIYKTSNQEYATHILNRKATQTGSASSTDTLWTVEFGEEHFVDLRMKTERSVLDDFGRPSNEWSYKKVTIGTYPIEADKTYTEQVAHNVVTVSNASKARSLELTGNVVDKNTVITVNGKDYSTTDVKSLIGANLTDVGQIADFTDNGTVVEVYIDVDRADWISNIVVIKTQLMEVKRLGKESVSLDLYDNGSSNEGDTVFGFNQPAIDKKVENVEIDDSYYSLLSGLKVGDLVAVVPVTTDGGSSYTVAEAYVPETVSGSLKKVNTFGTSSMSAEIKNVKYGNEKSKESTIGVTVGDTAYNIALWNKDLVDVDGDKLEVTTKDVTLTLDKFGNALLAKDVGATSDFMIVGSYYQNLVNGKLMTYVKGWDISGEELDLNLGSKYADTEKKTRIQPGDLVYYTNATTGDADWQLDDTNTRGVFNVFTGNDAQNSNKPYSIKASNSRVRIPDNSTAVGNNPWIDKGIKFIYVTFNDDHDVDSISIKNGVQAANNSELVKSGNSNNVNYNPAQVALKLKDGNVTADSTVKAVVIKNESNDAVASNMLYIVNYAGSAGKTDNGEIVYEYTVAMNGSSGLVDDEMTIYSTKKLSRGQWARYTAEKNEDFENFYKLSPVDQRGRATSTMDATFAVYTGPNAENGYPVKNNKSLVRVDPTKLTAIDGTTLRGTPKPDAAYCLPYITIAKGNSLGIGDDVAENVVSLRYAVWVDLTNNGIDSYEDLADLIDDGYSLSDVEVSMIFNDDNSKDNFRQVAMIVVQSVKGGSNGSTSSSADDQYTLHASVNSFGDVLYNVSVAKPDWADGTFSGTFNILVDDVVVNTTPISINEDGASGAVSVQAGTANFRADENSKITIKYLTGKWSKAKVNYSGDTLAVSASTTNSELTLSATSQTIASYTLTPNTYASVIITASQNGTAIDTKTAGYAELVRGTAMTIAGVVNGQGAVEVNIAAVKLADISTVGESSVTFNSAGVESADSGRAYEAWVTTQAPGVYAGANFSTDANGKPDASSPLYTGDADSRNCKLFVFETTDTEETYTFVITKADGTVVYTEQPAGPYAAGTHYFLVQVVGDHFYNSGDPNDNTGWPSPGTDCTYTIYGSNTGVLQTGTFTIPRAAV